MTNPETSAAALAALERLATGAPQHTESAEQLSRQLVSHVTDIREHVESLAASAKSLSDSSATTLSLTKWLLAVTLILLSVALWEVWITFQDTPIESTTNEAQEIRAVDKVG